MFAVVRYFNYRKNVSFKILKIFNSFKNADDYALRCAEDDFGDSNVVEGVRERWVYVDDASEGYTKGDGYDECVYTVMALPEAEDEDDTESIDSETEMPFMTNNRGEYEWGLDLTDFNEDEEQEDEEQEEGEKENAGARKFGELLQQYGLSLRGTDGKFVWSNEDGSLTLVTGNNPITGEYYSSGRHKERGYLSYVGITSKSTEVLKSFLREIRNKATFIKGESNVREYI